MFVFFVSLGVSGGFLRVFLSCLMVFLGFPFSGFRSKRAFSMFLVLLCFGCFC